MTALFDRFKLTALEQQKRLAEICSSCGFTLGEHSALWLQCPRYYRTRGGHNRKIGGYDTNKKFTYIMKGNQCLNS